MANDQLIQYIQRSISSAPVILQPKILSQQRRELPHRYAFLSIKKAVDDFIYGKKDNRWIIMSGLRGTGKTTLLAQIFFYLHKEKQVPLENIIYLSLDEVFGLLKSNLYEVIKSFEILIGSTLEGLDKKIYLLIDEAHYDKDWAITLKSIFDKTTNVFILTTGSCALALHTNPDISRRAQVERLYPLRFIEYVTLKYNIFPVKDKSNEISEALFLSNNAQEAYEKLKTLNSYVVGYWAKLSNLEIQKFLENGSLPFALNLLREDAYKRVLEMLNNVIYKDLTFQTNFQNETLKNFQSLLLLLATNETISIEKVCNVIKLNHQTVIDMIEALKRCELIDTVEAFGNAEKKLSKPPKYIFLAPMIKAAFLWSIGRFNKESEVYGELLEDVAVLYFLRAGQKKKILNFARRWGSNEADYAITTNDRKKIAIEFSFGKNKTKEQAETTSENIDAKYGIVVSETELKVENNIIFVPKRYFLLM
jgi:predicted AAA+ superfamily ATPase